MTSSPSAIQAVGPARYLVGTRSSSRSRRIHSHATDDVTAPPRTLAALAAAARAHPFERKLIMGPSAGAGRELLRALAAGGAGWIGFEATTPHRLAHELLADRLLDEGLEVADDLEELGLLDESMDAVLAGAAGRLAELAAGAGLRRAVAVSIRALRHSGHTAQDLEGVRLRDEDKRVQLARILAGYEARLREGRLIDRAGLLARALEALEESSSPGLPWSLAGTKLYVLPGQRAGGLIGRLLRLLLDRGAQRLPDEPVFGLEPPEGLLLGHGPGDEPGAALRTGASPLSWLHDVAGWTSAAASDAPAGAAAVPDAVAGPVPPAGDVVLDVFAASSVAAELREVLRRVAAAGLHWDEVEIIATDPVAYGVALDVLAQRLGIPVSHAAGLPLARTRPGRAVVRYLQWIRKGLPAELLRQMLEAGDLSAPRMAGEGTDAVSGVALARRLRVLRIGPGRDAYEAAVLRLEAGLAADVRAAAGPEDDRAQEELVADAERERAESAPLLALLRGLLSATPCAPQFSPADLAGGVLAVLERVPVGVHADAAAVARLRTRLERIRQTLTRSVTPAAAIAVITAELEARVAPPGASGGASGGAPWIASGGHLHVTDLEHGGLSGRRAVFVVGLDSGRFPGSVGGDALLVDEDRRRLAEPAGGFPGIRGLRTTAERTAEKRYAFASLVARLRGRVTFSYATWDAAEGRAVAPAAELLQVYRLMSGDPAADYEALHAATAPPVSAVPRGDGLLDAADVWLHVLAHDPAAPGSEARNGSTLRYGVPAVCAIHPQLAAGVAAWKARLRSGAPTPHHGFVDARPHFDPRVDGVPVSPTQLQALGTCAHRYLLRYVLRVRPPQDPELVPGQWLTALDRGTLLHAVFERSLRETALDDVDVASDAFAVRVLGILEDEIVAMRRRVPPPGEAVFTAESERMREDARAFVAMVREDGNRFIALERRFGRDGEAPVPVRLPDGTVLGLSGVIDRVDRLEDGTLVIVDYKTGSSLRYGGRYGPLDGGRRLQHVLYAAAAERLFDASVARAEYQFPSRRSENHRARYERRELRDGLAVVVDLLELARRGWFLPTNDPEDCRFCDFRPVCRVRAESRDRLVSPMAEWSREVDAEAAELLRRVRRGRPGERVTP